MNILIINGHPDKDSYCNALAEAYYSGAKQNAAKIKIVHLKDLDFDLNLKKGYKEEQELEPDLQMMQKEILKANHLVFVYPNWWGTYPALLKGFIDRTLLPGFAFKFNENSRYQDKYLEGKSARVIVTMNAPPWYYSFAYKKPGHNSMKKIILKFCGIKPVKITTIGSVKLSNDIKRKNWLEKVEKLGKGLK